MCLTFVLPALISFRLSLSLSFSLNAFHIVAAQVGLALLAHNEVALLSCADFPSGN